MTINVGSLVATTLRDRKKKLPEFRLDPERPPTFHGSIIAGPSTIHLVWNV